MILPMFLRFTHRKILRTCRTFISPIRSFRNMSEEDNSVMPKHIKYRQKMGSALPVPRIIEILVVGTGNKGTPRSVIVGMAHFSYLFNCGEGTQRIATAHKMRMSKIDQIFVTHNSWDNIGGMLGMALSLEQMNLPKVTLHGPPNVENLVMMTRGFAQLRSIQVEKHSLEAGGYEDHAMKVQYVPLYSQPHTQLQPPNKKFKHSSKSKEENMSIAYICKPHPKPPTLSLEKCVELGVPRGPQFGKLQKGETITLENGTVVAPEDVIIESGPGAEFLILECPDTSYIDSLVESADLAACQQSGRMEVVVHMSPPSVMADPRYKTWINGFGDETHHLVVNESGSEIVLEGVYNIQYKLNLIHDDIFPLLQDPHHDSKEEIPEWLGNNMTVGRTGMRYIVRGGKALHTGINTEHCFDLTRDTVLEEIFKDKEIEKELDSLKVQLQTRMQEKEKDEKSDKREYPEIRFLGTGSAIPSKARNVSAILIQMRQDEFMLLDCGENTYGQMCRIYGEATASVLRNLKAVYISHLHADHHMGLFGLLKPRHEAFESEGLPTPPLMILAPRRSIEWFDHADEQILNIADDICLIPLDNAYVKNRDDCRESYNKILHTLGMKELLAVKVWHSQSPHGIVLTHQEGWKLVYSGDTVPCDNLVRAGKDADFLIHEATMEDDLVQEAKEKRHSTTAQAIDIGVRMGAKFILLTHFSQRYAKVPIFSEQISGRVGIAFDNMRVRPCDLDLLPLFIPSLKAMFAEDYAEMEMKTQKVKKRKKKEMERLAEQQKEENKEDCDAQILDKNRKGKKDLKHVAININSKKKDNAGSSTEHKEEKISL